MTVGIVESGFQVDLLKIKVVKGNELTDLITETMDGGDFAKSTYHDPVVAGSYAVDVSGAITGWEAGKEVRVSKQIAVLGARGDYVEFLLDVTGLGTEAVEHLIGMFKVQALDYSGVPVAVQHSIFGKYSPFLTPTQPVSRGMIRGVDRQEIELANNVQLADPETTATNQKIRGTATSRFTGEANHSTVGSITLITFTAKPLSDGVFVIPRGAKIWAGNGLKGTIAYAAS